MVMGQLKPGATYIYETPDKGHTVYARIEGTNERILIGQSYDAFQQVEQRMWNEIYKNRHLNSTLQSQVEQCIITYKLIKDYKDGI